MSMKQTEMWKEIQIVKPRVSYSIRRVNDHVIAAMKKEIDVFLQAPPTILSEIQNMIPTEVVELLEGE